MWEQYAGNHAGVCFAFDRERALGHIDSHLLTLGMPGSSAVSYTPRGFRDTEAATLLLDKFKPQSLPEDVARFVIDHEHELFFVKTLDWQSEHEFRVTLVPNADAGEFVHVPFGGPDSVRAVILGEQFPVWQLPAARWACDQVGLRLLKLQWKNGLPRPLPAA